MLSTNELSNIQIISPSRAARKSPKVKVTHNTSVFNFTNDSKDDYIQSCWDEVSRKKE